MQNLKKTKRHRLNAILFSRGFTLIELLVVMTLLLAVGTIIGVILFSSLRGTSKTNTITAVRQNGNYAISQMVKTIRNANRFDGMSTDGINYITNCSVPTPPVPTPTSPPVVYNFIKITSVDGFQTTFICPDTSFSPSTIAAKNGGGVKVSLLDTTTVSLVSCLLTCTQASLSDAPTIGITFALKEQSGSSSLPVEKTANVSFQTSVTLRNQPR